MGMFGKKEQIMGAIRGCLFVLLGYGLLAAVVWLALAGATNKFNQGAVASATAAAIMLLMWQMLRNDPRNGGV